MSHIISGEVIVKDLDALETAAKTFGASLVRGKREYVWFGRSMGDSPLPKGMTVDDLGKCDHVIKLPGVDYEVGVVRQKDGTFTLAYDFFGNPNDGSKNRYLGGIHDGEALRRKFGDKLCLLQQAYNKALVTKQAKAKGYLVRERSAGNGVIELQLVRA